MVCAEESQNCSIATLHQSHLLCSKHSNAFQRIPLPGLLVLLLSTNQSNRHSETCLGRAKNVSSKSGNWLNATLAKRRSSWQKLPFFPWSQCAYWKKKKYHAQRLLDGLKNTYFNSSINFKQLTPDPVLLRRSNPGELISSFVDALDNLATEIKNSNGSAIL